MGRSLMRISAATLIVFPCRANEVGGSARGLSTEQRCLHLIKMWLEAPPVEETDGERVGTNIGVRAQSGTEGRGTPTRVSDQSFVQQSVHATVRAGVEEALGHEERWKAYIVNYADDLVICCRVGAEQALTEMRAMMSKLRLTVNCEEEDAGLSTAGREVRFSRVLCAAEVHG